MQYRNINPTKSALVGGALKATVLNPLVRESIKNNSNKADYYASPMALGVGMETSGYLPLFPMYGNRGTIATGVWFNGEVNPGGAGPIIPYKNDYFGLRLRGAQLYKESEICAAILNKLTEWVVGNGIKVKSEPRTDVLRTLGVTLTDKQKKTFSRDVEVLWETKAQSKDFDYSRQRTLPQLERQLFFSIQQGGDTLVIFRVVGDSVKIQLVDGASVCTPIGFMGLTYNGMYWCTAEGNRVVDGVEIGDDGRHIAYYVREGIIGIAYQRIEAYNKYSGMRMALLVGLNKDGVNDIRSLPLLSSAIETAQLISSYVRSATTAAKSRAKIAYTIEYGKNSTGEDPFRQLQVSRRGWGGDPTNAMAMDNVGNVLAKNASVALEAAVTAMPIDSKIQMHESKFEYSVPEFAKCGENRVASVAGVPRSIAVGESTASFSAARMDGKQFEHRVEVARQEFAQSFHDYLYELQIYLWVLSGKLKAKGYIEFCENDNELGKQAWAHNYWYGDKYPEIDDLKMVKFLREALGEQNAGVPLITPEYAAEMLGFNGDYKELIEANLEQTDNRFGIPPQPKQATQTAPKKPTQSDT